MNDQERLLTVFLRLQSGAHLSKLQLADEFGVNEKTIQSFFIRNNSVRNKASIKRFLLSSFETFFRSVITFPNYPCYSNGIPKKIKS